LFRDLCGHYEPKGL